MGKSSIEWCSDTWNPTTGCDRISEGCDNCYALTRAARLKASGSAAYQQDGDPRTSGPGFRFAEHEGRLDQPLRWQRRRLVFVNSMSDLFHQNADTAFTARVWDVMRRADRHVFQVLTKRPKRMRDLLLAWGELDADGPRPMLPLPNVWLGTSVELSHHAYRIDRLRETPAAVRFLSLEPLLGSLGDLNLRGIQQVIIGGESGHGARPMELEWAWEIMESARDAGAAVFVKQMGSAWARANGQRGKGGDPAEWPEWLRVREMPAGVEIPVAVAS